MVILRNLVFIVQPLVVMETICFLADSRRNGEQIRRMLWLAAALSPYTVIHSHHWTTRRTSSSDPPFWSSHWLRTSRGGKMRTFRTHLCFDWLCEKRSRNRRAHCTGIVRLPCINSMSLIPCSTTVALNDKRLLPPGNWTVVKVSPVKNCFQL